MVATDYDKVGHLLRHHQGQAYIYGCGDMYAMQAALFDEQPLLITLGDHMAQWTETTEATVLGLTHRFDDKYWITGTLPKVIGAPYFEAEYNNSSDTGSRGKLRIDQTPTSPLEMIGGMTAYALVGAPSLWDLAIGLMGSGIGIGFHSVDVSESPSLGVDHSVYVDRVQRLHPGNSWFVVEGHTEPNEIITPTSGRPVIAKCDCRKRPAGKIYLPQTW